MLLTIQHLSLEQVLKGEGKWREVDNLSGVLKKLRENIPLILV